MFYWGLHQVDRSPPSYFLFQPLNLSPSPLTFLLSVVRLSMHTWGHECLLSVFDIKFPLGAGLKRPVCLARSPDASPTRRWTRPGCNTLLECLEFSTTRISSSLSVVSGWCVCHSSPPPPPWGFRDEPTDRHTHTQKLDLKAWDTRAAPSITRIHCPTKCELCYLACFCFFF